MVETQAKKREHYSKIFKKVLIHIEDKFLEMELKGFKFEKILSKYNT